MTRNPDVYAILTTLRARGVIDYNAKIATKMSGTTDGLVYTLTVNEEPKYVLKIDNHQSISFVEQLHQAYIKSPVLPKLIYTDPAKTFIVYSYITGTTHNNRGSKVNWLSLLVKDLLNHYEINHQLKIWGRLELPRESWREFNERSLEGARNNVGSLLPIEDYYKVKPLIENISKVDDKYLLHGDTGVHNFIFHEFGLVGVIDPSPMVGPVIYDFTYAFCSSPDDLNLETLFAAFELFNHKSIERLRLIEEVTFQLYCRIGICAKVHPHDMDDYLKAWDNWRAHLLA
ncbi:MAG: phosphotransferase [Paenibacillaceae bacterium]